MKFELSVIKWFIKHFYIKNGFKAFRRRFYIKNYKTFRSYLHEYNIEHGGDNIYIYKQYIDIYFLEIESDWIELVIDLEPNMWAFKKDYENLISILEAELRKKIIKSLNL